MTKEWIIRFAEEWGTTRLRVMRGLKMLGHDIPITGYTPEEEMKLMTMERRALNAKQR